MLNLEDLQSGTLGLWALLCVFGSSLLFIILNKMVTFFIPQSAQTTLKQTWKWKNVMISFIHSLIAGIWAVASFYCYPQMAMDLINFYSVCSHLLVSFSVGYFIYDFCDLSFNHKKRSSFELMVHHAFVIVCFGLTVITHLYIGYAIVALLVEINSVFLHLRQLLIIVGTSKSNFWYRLNSLMNIATYIVFRIAVLGWMTRWLVLHRDDLSLPVYSLGSIGLAVIVLMNIVLFIRICSVDFSPKRSSEPKPIDHPSKKIGKESESAQSNLLSSTRNFHLD